jgi:hypothetical protein
MHPANYSKPREANESGKFGHVPVAGVHRIDNHGYKQHQYEISGRQVGLTVKRTTYSVTILGEFGEHLSYLTDLPSTLAARQAAESWIDREIRRRPKRRRMHNGKYIPAPVAPHVEAADSPDKNEQ